jgi:plasmid stabilization system protein ParE
MAPVTVRFHPAAAQQAESTYDWYAVRDPTAARAFREELRHAVDVVADNPAHVAASWTARQAVHLPALSVQPGLSDA